MGRAGTSEGAAVIVSSIIINNTFCYV